MEVCGLPPAGPASSIPMQAFSLLLPPPPFFVHMAGRTDGGGGGGTHIAGTGGRKRTRRHTFVYGRREGGRKGGKPLPALAPLPPFRPLIAQPEAPEKKHHASSFSSFSSFLSPSSSIQTYEKEAKAGVKGGGGGLDWWYIHGWWAALACSSYFWTNGGCGGGREDERPNRISVFLSLSFASVRAPLLFHPLPFLFFLFCPYSLSPFFLKTKGKGKRVGGKAICLQSLLPLLLLPPSFSLSRDIHLLP